MKNQMKNIIVCPKCGVVDRYGYVEQVRRTLLFSADGEPLGATEDVAFYTGSTPRCLCGSKVRVVPKDCKTCKHSQDSSLGLAFDNDFCKFCKACDEYEWNGEK